MDQSNSQFIGVLRLSRTCFPQKCPFPFGDRHPHVNTLFLGPNPLIIPNGMSIGSAVFVCVPNSMLYNVLSMGKKTPFAPSPWDFVTVPEKDRATVIGNMHKNLVKIARVVPEISSRTDRQTDTHTHRHSHQSSQYFATAVADEVINCLKIMLVQ